MNRIVLTGAVLVIGFAGAGVSLADGPGHSTYGRCTAYFAGSDNGQSHKRQAPPFQQLEYDADQASDNPDGQTSPQEVADYCTANGQQPGNGGGNNGGGGGNNGGGGTTTPDRCTAAGGQPGLAGDTIAQQLYDGGLSAAAPLIVDPEANGPISSAVVDGGSTTPLAPVTNEAGCAVSLVGAGL